MRVKNCIICGITPTVRITNIIVRPLLNTCSSICEKLVARISESPWKYPRITDDTQTKNKDGARARITYCEPFIFIICTAIKSEPAYNMMVHISPIIENSFNAVANTLCAPL